MQPEHDGDDVVVDLDGAGLRRERHARDAVDVVAPDVAELDRPVVADARILEVALGVAVHAPDLEDVGEVGAEGELDVERHGVRVVVLHADAFE